MKVVVDTNVLISAVWRDKGPEAVIFWIVDHDDWDWVVTNEILQEYREVLRREKFSLSSEIIEHWENILSELTVSVSTEQEIDFPRDQKDAKFLACALASNADYIITGDRDFNEARKLVKTTILSVSTFKRLICDTE